MEKSGLVAKEGYPFMAIFIGVAAVSSALSWYGIVQFVLWVLAGWCIWFFRDPERHSDAPEDAVIAPADGRVVAIREMEKGPLTDEPVRMVSIFMNVFNVHVNRAPIAGTVTKISYHPGKFVNADLDKASIENERNVLLMESPAGVKMAFQQVAGLVARRIVCRINEGTVLQRGERFGLIRFGSRVDLFFPMDAEISVKLGEMTHSGVTQMGRLKGKES
ncbi:phosphatidylserine decarboxylase related protein [Magnetococcus marinus MC-1]|uniref:Phosphatidylserine decarboxylase proenzyme n=1 Tax=Magnetococcus marinus (strain ATCC BAA-1437 / JCM 17883 / MC-1) TaxID=156889 RepID=PSD_MAGMM|nr:phosphatidylserine decarboxylase family protein [Magnetococcus marinus]A0L627.1 RecName: Full=Phosphatidylserine decarboxylase proenzyme; Contains: RecName: Full=Phosphatidylserine decarboxylase alpha chain; Contains: RecName: Full=Phosphatidylserine decarboxylase beta chain [Magnetococcus marinus MC-1]ABK43420.1 phosphatidylserine decarboxylase related protein [Magnetococcus marinus MC-1]